jgi:hypothetical protein
LALMAITSCGVDSGTGVGTPRDLSGALGEDLSGGDDLMSLPGDDGSADMSLTGDLSQPPLDGAGAYGDLGNNATDGGQCVPPQTGAACAMPIAANAGCVLAEDCGPSGSGNGLDDNCDGNVDEGCACTPGAVEPCFLGPPGKHNKGACTDGTQTCEGVEFGTWGKCKGSIGPSYEVCDKLDNDCNGCADDELCCDATLACPGSVPDAAPFTTITYNGASYFKGSAATWTWTVEGGPCDQLFLTTTNPVTQSYTLTGANTAMPSLTTTLSGDYTVTMTVVDTGGKTYTCKWVQHVIGPGLRFELCWDHTGTAAQGGADLDLHVHKPGTTTTWLSTAGPGMNRSLNTDDCGWNDCTASAYVLPPNSNWGYANSPLAACNMTPLGSTWTALGYCHNPRLDIDNVNKVGVPENTNIDDPADGQTFRAMVHYYGQDNVASTNAVEEHPIVNVYCGGRLKATYGQAPNTLGPCPGATCFNTGMGGNIKMPGLMWRVADVTVQVDGTGTTTGCNVTPIHPPGTTSGYYVTNNDFTY